MPLLNQVRNNGCIATCPGCVRRIGVNELKAMLDDDTKGEVAGYNPEDHIYRRLVAAYINFNVDDYKAGRPTELESALVWMTPYALSVQEEKGPGFCFDDLYEAYVEHCFWTHREYTGEHGEQYGTFGPGCVFFINAT